MSDVRDSDADDLFGALRFTFDMMTPSCYKESMIVIIRRIDNGFIVETLIDGARRFFEHLDDALQCARNALALATIEQSVSAKPP